MSIMHFKLSVLLFFIILTANAGYSFKVIAQEDSLVINKGSCVKCHKRNGKMFGVHANDALALECQTCHGEKGKHPRKPNKVVAFGAASVTSIVEQVEVCMKCHDPQLLSIADWTHDAHSTKVACSDCHHLHAKEDSMIGLEPTQHSQLCRRCHAKRGDE